MVEDLGVEVKRANNKVEIQARKINRQTKRYSCQEIAGVDHSRRAGFGTARRSADALSGRMRDRKASD